MILEEFQECTDEEQLLLVQKMGFGVYSLQVGSYTVRTYRIGSFIVSIYERGGEKLVLSFDDIAVQGSLFAAAGAKVLDPLIAYRDQCIAAEDHVTADRINTWLELVEA